MLTWHMCYNFGLRHLSRAPAEGGVQGLQRVLCLECKRLNIWHVFHDVRRRSYVVSNGAGMSWKGRRKVQEPDEERTEQT